MKQHDGARHPGPMRVMRVDAEFAGILVAIAFIVLGLVSLPMAKWFFLGALVLGVGVALLLRFTRKG
jgi:hypothetical protein